jgi:hypothetical protein
MKEIIVLLAIAAPFVGLYWTGRIRRREALFTWASNHGFKILGFRQPVLTELSPFPLTASKAQQIFQIEVQDAEGNQRSGWIRLGSIWRGLASDRAEVRWD